MNPFQGARDIIQRARDIIIGPPLDPLKASTRRHILLIAFLAWIGLGADGLSSSCYGPQEAFLALGQHTALGLYLAVATALTVFIISSGYNQVIELFPTGGGGYKVATALIHPFAGLVSGTALVIDYVLTITISIASGVDALFSLLPVEYQPYKLFTEALLILILVILNLRGIKESIIILAPIFLGFFITHVFLIFYGVYAKLDVLPSLIPDTFNHTAILSKEMGSLFVIALFLRAYSLGGGTYTGIEAVSNNVNILVEPRIKTGKWTMFYMAFSLSLVAGGIILLYLLWHVTPEEGKTLNATTFNAIMHDWQWQGWDLKNVMLPLVMLLEAGLLFVAANTGILDGPNVLSNMAVDSWVPTQFRLLSSRLVIKNGIIFMGLASMGILFWTQGAVNILVIMYSINVFLTFSLSLCGLSMHWWKNRTLERKWLSKLSMSFLGFTVAACILCVTVVEKFESGGWVTLGLTGSFICIFYFIRKHYQLTDKKLKEVMADYYEPQYLPVSSSPHIDHNAPTAIFFIDNSIGMGMHTLMEVQKLFPNLYKNFIFLGIGEIDSDVYRKEMVKKVISTVNSNLKYFVNYCHDKGLASTSHQISGTDTVECISRLANEMKKNYPNAIFFSGEIIFEKETWITRWLHNHTPQIIQRILHSKGMQMVLLPINLA